MDDLLAFNGLDGSTGGYLHPPESATSLARIIRAETLATDDVRDLEERSQAGADHFGVIFGVDSEDLAQAGWGLVIADGTPDDVLEALSDLRDMRQTQAGDLYREYMGDVAPRPEESKSSWLARHKMGPGPANPKKVPYYLLLIGDPERLPYTLQYQLDVQYAVGRLSFETAEEYATYARSVVLAERGQRRHRSRKIELFGPRNIGDRSTQLSSTQLVSPLGEELEDFDDSWRVGISVGENATKERLTHLLAEDDAPGILFTASHGLGFAHDKAEQRERQGALVCQDWPGPLRWSKPISDDFCFAGADVTATIRPEVVFAFACFGAGTPRLDDFAHLSRGVTASVASHPFVARLPQRLLAAPASATLAFIGHVERAWSCSFNWPGAGEQREAFTSCLQAVMSGWRVGHAVNYTFNQKYADLSAELSDKLYRVQQHREVVPDVELARLWTSNNDARSYVVIGDPAVRAPSAVDQARRVGGPHVLADRARH
jgi:hypothetical protein